jgi:hypothetical protein
LEFTSAVVTVAAAYESEALQPPPEEEVSLSLARQYALDCDAAATPERCAILTGLFAHGETTAGAFPPSTKICRGF